MVDMTQRHSMGNVTQRHSICNVIQRHSIGNVTQRHSMGNVTSPPPSSKNSLALINESGLAPEPCHQEQSLSAGGGGGGAAGGSLTQDHWICRRVRH